MTRRVWLAAWLGTSVALVLPVSAQSVSAPAAAGIETIRLDLSGPRPVAMLAIGDGAAVPVIFDTGASGNVLDVEYARASGLENLGEALVRTPAGAPMQGFRTRLPRARLGGVAIDGVRAVALPMPALSHLRVRGVFGAGTFAGRLVHLDLARGELRITPKDSAHIPAGTAHPYSGEAGHPGLPGVPVEIGGRTFAGHIDTGQPGTLMFPTEMAADLPLDGPLRPAERSARFADGVARSLYDARIRGTVRIGPLVFENPEVKFMDGLRRVNVGVQALRGVTVVLDPAERRSWLVASE
jgi:hypothetical protein